MKEMMSKKLKRYTIYPLLAMGMLFGGMCERADADQLSEQELYDLTGYNHRGILSQAEKEEALQAFKKNAKEIKLPQKFIDLVTMDTIYDNLIAGNRAIMYIKDGMYITLDRKLASLSVNRYGLTADDIAEPLPPLSNGKNTVTKKPYFTLPKPLIKQLSGEDKAYFKTLLKVMNQNFGTLMQMYTLDQKKVDNNEYTGKVPDMPCFYFGTGFDGLEQGLDETEISLRRQLGFVTTGYVDAIERVHAKVEIGASDCAGWTVFSLRNRGSDGKLQGVSVVVYNGFKNHNGRAYYQAILLEEKMKWINVLYDNFHALMQENGVEPKTDVKDKKLIDARQRVFAYLGNVLDNYCLTIYPKMKEANPFKEEIKGFDALVKKENYKPAQSKSTKVASQKQKSKSARERTR